MTRKGKFLKKVNQAFAEGDIEYIIENVTDDIRWTVPGDFSLQGKEHLREMLEKMKSNGPYELLIQNIITHGDSAAVDGIMKIPVADKIYAFCDVYKFSGFKNPKINEMTSYVIEAKGV